MMFAPTTAARFTSAFALALALAACGGGNDQADEPTASVTDATPLATPGATDTATPAATPTPEATPSESPSPTATPSAKATATTAAAAAPVEPAAFAQCKACHSVEPGKNGIGPSLAGIWGEKAGAVPGFEFSQPMKDSGLVWNQATLDKYLTDPRGVVPGTKMAFGGVKDAAKRQALIDYIKGL
ncbi:c-type cytochrome [Altererythrobacter sp. Root672]|uniref:c-type cytochrome n=1 Tax=Altererythrobacter sp. Root672 TaxID=1736584 RepID=UPI000A65134A|nr:c-type cytochrome [Altererythrobacter sp. Root672]